LEYGENGIVFAMTNREDILDVIDIYEQKTINSVKKPGSYTFAYDSINNLLYCYEYNDSRVRKYSFDEKSGYIKEEQSCYTEGNYGRDLVLTKDGQKLALLNSKVFVFDSSDISKKLAQYMIFRIPDALF
jgi:hypothetical protein